MGTLHDWLRRARRGAAGLISHVIGMAPATGRMAVVRIILRPDVAFAGPRPAAGTLDNLHAQAHERCFIANSLNTEIIVEPR